MAVKYKEYVKKMYEEHKELFDKFDGAHAAYVLDRAKGQDEFNEVGKDVLRVVEDWERKLCRTMEKGKNSSYSHRLADKFREELRKRYAKFDFIGVKIKKPAEFTLPKINFS